MTDRERILVLDIENSPLTAHVWSIWQQNVGLPQIINPGQVLCFAAKWLGDYDPLFDSVFHSKREDMLANAHFLLDQADVVVGWNSDKHDLPWLNREFILQGWAPPS
ncbi:MAG: ribonuclease H-like domain-containing protein, partial [bacterium]